MSTACQILHQRLSNPPRFSLDAPSTDNGIYVAFERGENAHGTDRIVHIGANTSDGGLLRRINYIYKSKKDLNIFRKHIGSAILKKRGDSLFDHWHASHDKIDSKEQERIEKEVTDYIKRNITFAIIPVLDVEEREKLKSMLLSTIKACPDCTPSKKWLGTHHSNSMINNSGLWNIRGYAKTTLSSKDAEALDIQTSQDMFVFAKENLSIFENRTSLLDDEITEINDELKTLIASAPEPKTAPTFTLGDDNYFHITPPPDNQPVNIQDVSLKTLRETIDALLKSRIWANTHPELTPIVEEYKEVISGDQVSISEIYWSGVKFDNAVQILKENLSFNAKLDLETALDVHGVYITLNEEGRNLVNAATAYHQPAKQTEELKQAIEQLSYTITESRNLLGADVREHVSNAVKDIGQGQHPERSNQRVGNILTNLVSGILGWIKRNSSQKITDLAINKIVEGIIEKDSIWIEKVAISGALLLVNIAPLLLMLVAPLAGEQSWLASAAYLLERIRLMIKNKK